MWNPTAVVAQVRFLDPVKFEAFVQKDPQKYGIVDGEVNTWHVDQLVKDYILDIGPEVYETDRQAAIQALKTLQAKTYEPA